jgi:S1-C subfamily serine protease
MQTSLTLIAALSLGAPALKEKEPLGSGPGYLGITFQKDDVGLMITDVKADGPAAKAGVKVNDVVLAVEGTSLRDAETGDFVKMVGGMRPGTVIALEVKRGADTLTLKVKLGVRPKDFSPTPVPIPPQSIPDGPK